MSTATKVDIQNSSRENPCGACGDTHGWCGRTKYIQFCRKQPVHPTLGRGEEKTDKNGATYWVFRTGEAGFTDWPEPRYQMQAETADADTLHRVYHAFLLLLTLSIQHKKELLQRGLNPDQIKALERHGCRTIPDRGRAKVVRKLIEASLEQHLAGVPGFIIKTGGNRKQYWTFGGAAGLIIPIRDHEGRIVGLKIRRDVQRGGAKYTIASSKRHGGAGPGSPLHFPKSQPTEQVRITEGELKAEIATILSGIYTISLPGVGSWRRAPNAAKLIKARSTLVAFDADWRTNPTVAGHLQSLLVDLQTKGFEVKVETWDPALGKGIDDLLTAGHQPELRSPADVLKEIDQIGFVTPAASKSAPWHSLNSQAERKTVTIGNQKLAPDEADAMIMARGFLDAHAYHDDGYKLRFHRSQFWFWTGTHYIPLTEDEIRGRVIRQHLDPLVNKINRGMVGNVIECIRALTLLDGQIEPPHWLGDPPHRRNYVAVANGLLDVDAVLRGKPDRLLDHSPLWFSPVCLPFAFDPLADCPRWIAFLDRNLEGDQQRILILQEWLGYCLLPDTSLQKFLVLVGEGANGKSVACAGTAAMLGEGNVSHVPLEMFGMRFQLAATVGKLANIAAEVGELDRVAEGMLKAFTAGDRMQFEQKHKSPFEAMPTARMMLATNNLPRFSDRSGGLWRRLILMQFRVTIPAEERVPGMDKPEWWREQGELPGMLNWALAGLKRLREQKRFTESDLGQRALGKFKADCNPAEQFLRAKYREHDHGSIVTAEAYAKYTEWCAKNGYRPLSSGMFGKEIVRAFPTADEGKVRDFSNKRVRGYRGIAEGGEDADDEN